MSLAGLEMSYERVLSFKNRDREVSGQTVTPIFAAIRGQGSPGRNGEERESVTEYDEEGTEEDEERGGRR